ncbi:uncharacterized protein LOC110721495 [Chenopodium quinoa]|uniref:Uncharacterized protein n=1 Tax=Chenopodium quinoa TaxID=63459 RepID=A0A803LIA4_CHEQI|nr:uncharacterized protein LOC110721495 [Chenopodium quinoa]
MSTFSKIFTFSFIRKDKMEEETGKTTPQIFNSFLTSTLADRNEIEGQISTDKFCISSVFGSVSTRAEADYSMTAIQSFMNLDSPRMLAENARFQQVEAAFQFMKTPGVQDMVKSVMCDIGIITAMLKNSAVQGLLRSLMPGNSAIRLINGTTNTAAALAADSSQPQGSQSEHSLVSMVLSWLLENIGSGLQGIFGTLRSLVDNTLESPQIENIGSGSNSGQVIHLTLFLSVINLLIVFVRRALKQKVMV